ncbi:MAG: hypothetical protein ABEJ69_00595 [Candidatus Nanohaloarchaea archaeon]
MTDKNKTLSTRIEEFKYDFLKDFAEETDASLTEIQRTHLDQLSHGVFPSDDGYHVDSEEVDEAYRELILQLNAGDVDSLDEFVEENYGLGSVEETAVEEVEAESLDFADAMEDIVLYADAMEYEQAEEVIEDWREQGYDREALLMDIVLNQYRV